MRLFGNERGRPLQPRVRSREFRRLGRHQSALHGPDSGAIVEAEGAIGDEAIRHRSTGFFVGYDCDSC